MVGFFVFCFCFSNQWLSSNVQWFLSVWLYIKFEKLSYWLEAPLCGGDCSTQGHWRTPRVRMYRFLSLSGFNYSREESFSLLPRVRDRGRWCLLPAFWEPSVQGARSMAVCRFSRSFQLDASSPAFTVFRILTSRVSLV